MCNRSCSEWKTTEKWKKLEKFLKQVAKKCSRNHLRDTFRIFLAVKHGHLFSLPAKSREKRLYLEAILLVNKEGFFFS